MKPQKHSRKSNCRDIRIVVFDLEGTLIESPSQALTSHIEPSAWTVIARELGVQALREEKQLAREWTSGKLRDSAEWTRKSISIQKNHGLTKKKFESTIQKSTKIRGGARAFVNYVQKKGVKTAIITGGLTHQARVVAKKLDIPAIFGSCEYRWNTQGHIAKTIIANTDYEHKTIVMEQFAKRFGCLPENVLVVCNGANDVPLAQHAGIALGISPAKKLKAYCLFSSEGEHAFRNLLQHVKDEELRRSLSLSGPSRNHSK